MATLNEYAILSAAVYQDARSRLNVNPLPFEWDEIDYPSDTNDSVLTSGFTAGDGERVNSMNKLFLRDEFPIRLLSKLRWRDEKLHIKHYS